MNAFRNPIRLALLAAIAGVVTACAFGGTAEDPVDREAQIASARAEELNLAHATIADPDRAERFVVLLDERDNTVEGFAGTLAAHKERMGRLNADYQSERSDFEQALADYNRERSVAQSRMVDLIADMKRATTADEWEVIAAFQQDRLKPRDLAFRGLAGGAP